MQIKFIKCFCYPRRESRKSNTLNEVSERKSYIAIVTHQQHKLCALNSTNNVKWGFFRERVACSLLENDWWFARHLGHFRPCCWSHDQNQNTVVRRSLRGSLPRAPRRSWRRRWPAPHISTKVSGGLDEAEFAKFRQLTSTVKAGTCFSPNFSSRVSAFFKFFFVGKGGIFVYVQVQ